jgi:SWI/SNF-related matrix-associated actin-dependent regulator 1 of chromatin subfamily A
MNTNIALSHQIITVFHKTFLFFSFFEFGVRYCAGVKNSFGWDFMGSSNMKELHLILESHLMIRRLKSDVISQLPSKVRCVGASPCMNSPFSQCKQTKYSLFHFLRQMVIMNPEVINSKSKEMKHCVGTLNQQHLTATERRGALLKYYCATGKAKLKAIQ